jgi:hypothetical protein
MKRAITIAVLGAFCGSALANGGGQQLSAASASSKANASASSRSQAVGLGVANAQGGAGGNGFGGTSNALGVGGDGGQGFGGTASAAGGSVSYNVPGQQTITSNGRVQIENVPNVMAPGNWPTAPCSGSSSVGAGWLGFGFSGGTSWIDSECQLMEASRQAPTTEDRVFVWCKAASAKGSPSCKQFEGQEAQTSSPATAPRARKEVAATREWWEQ